MKKINKQLQEIVKRAIDIHVHIGPEIIPRKYTVNSLIKTERGKLGGCVLKNHFYPTSPFIEEIAQKDLLLFGGIVLNNFVGGLNSEAVYAASLMSSRPLMVWFPTVSSKNFLQKSDYELAPEWIQQKKFIARNAQDISGISVLSGEKISKQTEAVLRMIKKTNAILATGHISTEESVILITAALEKEISKIVITHPIYQKISMDIRMQKKLAAEGCFIEQSYSMYSIDKIPIGEIAKQIKVVGTSSVILSSDVGQPFSPSPSEALYLFGTLLIKQGFSLSDLEKMMVRNSRKLLGIE